MVKIDSLPGYPLQSAQQFAKEHGLQRLSKAQLGELANDQGVVGLTALKNLALGATLDTDGKLTAAERARIDSYLKDRRPVVVDLGGSSAVSVRSTRRKPVGEYVKIMATVKGGDVVFELMIDPVGKSIPRQVALKGFSLNNTDDLLGAVSYERYGEGGHNASVGSQAAGYGAGYMVGIADPKRGAVLVNISNAGALAKDPPDVRPLFTPDELAKLPAVKQAAKKAGLDPKALELSVTKVGFHSDFVVDNQPSADLHTMTIHLQAQSPRKSAKELVISAYVEGNPTKALSKMKIGEFEAGANFHFGFVYPASFDEESTKRTSAQTDGDGVRGGGEGSTRGGVRGGGESTRGGGVRGGGVRGGGVRGGGESTRGGGVRGGGQRTLGGAVRGGGE
jgi:hypothetical protein